MLTLRGARAIAEADVLVVDRLVDPGVLTHARTDAVVIDAGKRPERHHLTQGEINATLVEHARRGAHVVRVKGGDPFVYGRGMEEAEACRVAGIEVRVTPGITSALSAPMAAGVSVTERGVARTVAIATPAVGAVGAVGAEDRLTDADIAALVGIDSVSLLMGRAALGETVSRFVDAGRAPDTPVVVVQDATTSSQRVLRSTLAEVAADADAAGLRAPVVVTIGAVAVRAGDEVGALGAASDAIGPLAGRSVLVTRPIVAGRRIAGRLRALGAEVVEAPLIRIEYLDPEVVDVQGGFGWAVFTSLHAVRGFERYLDRFGLDARAMAGTRIAAVGPRTAEALRGIGLRADFVPAEHRAAALVGELAGLWDARVGAGERVLFPCGTLALEEVPAGLRAAGAEVVELKVYDTLPMPTLSATRRRIEMGVDAIALYSPTAARALAAEGLDLGGAQIAAIGPTTADAARDAGLRVDVVPDVYADEGMAEALVATIGSSREASVEVSR